MTSARQRLSRINGPGRSDPGAGSTQTEDQGEQPVSGAVPALEWVLPVIYPIILLLGSAFSVISPDVRQSRHSGEIAPSYFARKSNVFNLYFVKVGWAWTMLAFTLFVLLHAEAAPPSPTGLVPRRFQAMIRLGALTLWWIAVSQWFFGPALMERSFRITGGACELQPLQHLQQAKSGSFEITTQGYCRHLGGIWKGGYDISGHVFLLVLSSAALFLEARPHLPLETNMARRTPSEGIGATTSASDTKKNGWTVELSFLSAVISLDLWMLFMTAIYFHTFSEKVAGLLVSYAGLVVVYYLPRLNQPLYTALGRPGH